jgi:hypothetical protein
MVEVSKYSVDGKRTLEVKYGKVFVEGVSGGVAAGYRASHCFRLEKIGRVQVCCSASNCIQLRCTVRRFPAGLERRT